jgi:signal transduction histidine kinase/AmiR/NasT family two-component response regulator
MRILAAGLSVLVLVVLLTWLSLRGFDSGAERFDSALGELDRLDAAEANLHGNILRSRAGLLHNYDPLVRDVDALDTLLRRMRASTADEPATEAAIDGLTASVRRQEELTEQFKSYNALLQNSLALFSLFSANLGAPNQADPLASEVSALAAAMLHFTLDTSSTNAGAVQVRLDELARRIPPGDGPSPATALLAHGRLLHDLLPATDRVLRTLDGLSRMRDQEAMRTLLLTRQLASRTTARRFRSLLYLISLVLLGVVVQIGALLRSRASALRRRSAFEHVLTEISVRFVTARGPDLEPIVEHALAAMAACVGADRAYFVAVGAVARASTWHRPGLSFPPGWPDEALALLRQHNYPAVDRVVHVSNVAHLPPGAAKDALAASGLKGWACVTSRSTNGAEMLLGFDAVMHPCQITPGGELGLLRMGLDTIASALGRQTLEQERIRLETRLGQARRLETVGTLASGIAHNFNNIIGAILGYVEYADEQYGTSRVLDEIRKAGERARELVDQILTFARRRDEQCQIVSVASLIGAAVSLLRVSLPAGVQLAVSDVPDGVVVRGAEAHLQQVVLNLCNNAAQAMNDVGRIELDVDAVDLSQARTLSHGLLAAGRYVRIVVSDTGRGMDEAVLARIFEPFFTTRVTGSGLGLATSRDIVREHGGAMHVESSLDVGTRFEAWLPCLDVGSPDTNATSPFGQGETVLIFDCDKGQRLHDEEILAALGYEPVGFSVGADAYAAYQASPQGFDLVLLAHPTAVMEMLELSARMRQVAPGTPILLATSSADAVSAGELMSAGVSDVVPWPLDAADTIAALQDCLRRGNRQPLSSSFAEMHQS